MGKFVDALERLADQILVEDADEEKSYKMGMDYAENGANTTNCHFSLFRTKRMTSAWERGRDRAAARKGKK